MYHDRNVPATWVRKEQRVSYSAAARFRLADHAHCKEKLELLRLGIDEQHPAAVPPSLTSSSTNKLQHTVDQQHPTTLESILSNANVREVRRLLEAKRIGSAMQEDKRQQGATSDDAQRRRRSTTTKEDEVQQPDRPRPVTVGDILRRRKENWLGSSAPTPSSNGRATNATARRECKQPPPRGCSRTAQDPVLELLAEQCVEVDSSTYAAGRVPPSTAENSPSCGINSKTAGALRRPQSVGGTWDDRLPSNWRPSSSINRLLDSSGIACCDIVDEADDVFDLVAKPRHHEDGDPSSAEDSDMEEGEPAPSPYTHEDLLRMQLEIERYELSEQLSALTASRVALQRAKDARSERRSAIERAAYDAIVAYNTNHNLVAAEMDSAWAAHRKMLDEQRAAMRLRQLPVVNGTVRKKFLLPKFPSPWVTAFGQAADEEAQSKAAMQCTSEQQQQQRVPQARADLMSDCSDSEDAALQDGIGPSSSLSFQHARGRDRKRLASMPVHHREEIMAMRTAEVARLELRVEPSERDSIGHVEQQARRAMIAILEEGLVEESRRRRMLANSELRDWTQLIAIESAELRALQVKEWAPVVFADKKRAEERAKVEVASESERCAALAAATEAHRCTLRARWDKTFQLREELLVTQRLKLSKKEDIRAARLALSNLQQHSQQPQRPHGVSISRADVEWVTREQRLSVLELQVVALDDKMTSLRRDIEHLQQSTW